MVTIKTLNREEAAPYMEDLARLRIAVFREWPYLYEGDMPYEMGYLDTFLKAQDSFMVVVLDGEEVVGASTGLPLTEETPNIQQPFVEAGLPLGDFFYFGESVLLPSYRGQGIGKAFFRLRESFARSLGFPKLTFCAVARPEEHPLRPAGYQPLDVFWERCGFRPSELHCYISWQEIGEAAASPKMLRFWSKTLQA